MLGAAPPAAQAATGLQSFMLTTPAGVPDAAGPAIAWRDAVRNYDSQPIVPASAAVPLGTGASALYGAGLTMQLVDNGTGSLVQRFGGGDPWPASAGKPAHVDQAEWDACKRPFTAKPLQAVKSDLDGLRAGAAGGLDCGAARAAWGAGIKDGYPLSADAQVRHEMQGNYAGRSITWGIPSYTREGAYVVARVPFGYACGSLCTEPDAGKSRFFNTNSAGERGNLWMQVLHKPSTGERRIASQVTASESLSTWGPVVDGVVSGMLYITLGQPGSYDPSRGWYPAELYWTRTCEKFTTTEYIGQNQRICGFDGIHYNPGGDGLGPSTAPAADGEVKIFTTSIGADGTKITCSGDAFIVKNGERIPLPCTPGPLPPGVAEAERVVELVAKPGWPGFVPKSKPEQLVASTKPTTAYSEWKAGTPECSGSSQRCTLDLVKSGKSCFENPAACEAWTEDVKQPSHPYVCKYGGNAVALTECSVYSPTFSSQNRDAGEAYAPKSGEPGDTSAPTKPGTIGGGPGPGDDECFPEGYGAANPVEWVMQPVTCAILAAVTPRPGAVEAFNAQLQSDLAGSSIGRFATSVESIPAMFQQQDGCGGIPFNVSIYGADVSGQLFESCTEPWASVANYVRTVLAALLFLSLFMAGSRYLGAAFGFVGFGVSALESSKTEPASNGKGGGS